MRHQSKFGFIVAIGTMFVACAYPHLEMGPPVATGGKPPIAQVGKSGATGATSVTGGASNAVGAGGAGGAQASGISAGGAQTSVIATGGAGIIGTTTIVAAAGGVTVTALATGGTPAAAGGGAVSLGGASGANGGATIGTVASAGASTIAPCGASLDLIAVAASSETGNWFGGDPNSTADDPCGLQGAIYVYSDDGPDNTPGTGDESIKVPALDPEVADGKARLSPCTGGHCCISGETLVYPVTSLGDPDYSVSVWGGGIGIALHDMGDPAVEKRPYSGSVRGFTFTLSGELSGQIIRIAYTQRALESVAPFKEYSALGTYTVLFTGVTCPNWELDPPCVAPTASPYDVQLQIVGGEVSAPFTLCVESITPVL